MLAAMKIRKFATICLLVLSSFAANSVAPSKTELESMYDKAFREFDAGNYAQALKDLDSIDARQPDLAESQNLRGVIHMRQKEYDKAEVALRKALSADPKFWNARFNLAEVPFLQKNWAERGSVSRSCSRATLPSCRAKRLSSFSTRSSSLTWSRVQENMVGRHAREIRADAGNPAAHYRERGARLAEEERARSEGMAHEGGEEFLAATQQALRGVALLGRLA
jgi:tetratricopeptide (TPR) repeat protein